MTIEERALEWSDARLALINIWSSGGMTADEYAAATAAADCSALRSAFLAGAEAMQKAILKRKAFNVPFIADLDPASLLSALEGEGKDADADTR